MFGTKGSSWQRNWKKIDRQNKGSSCQSHGRYSFRLFSVWLEVWKCLLWHTNQISAFSVASNHRLSVGGTQCRIFKSLSLSLSLSDAPNSNFMSLFSIYVFYDLHLFYLVFGLNMPTISTLTIFYQCYTFSLFSFFFALCNLTLTLVSSFVDTGFPCGSSDWHSKPQHLSKGRWWSAENSRIRGRGPSELTSTQNHCPAICENSSHSLSTDPPTLS